MKHVFSILALLVITTVLGPGVLGQCTISNATIQNLSISSSNASFDLRFEHVRNSGNKWLTIHLWNMTDYPAYEYTSGTVPTTARLSTQIPFGTIVIKNTMVDATGTYTAAQAFNSEYQPDVTFPMATGSGSTLVYDAATNVYILKLLNVTLPGTMVNIKADVWSSQAATNQVAHCFQVCVPIVITPMAARGLESFKAQKGDGTVTFTWTTQMEDKTSHFVFERQDGSDWVTVGVMASKNPNGTCSVPTSYILKVSTRPVQYAALTAGFLIMIGLLLSRRKLVPLGMMCMLFYGGLCVASCKKALDQHITQQSVATWYRISEVDLDGKKTFGPARLVE